MKSIRSVERRARVFSALGDPTRLRIAEYLSRVDEATGTEMADALGISLSLLCHHAKLLTDAGVLKKRKQGQGTYYSLNAGLIEQMTRF